MRFYNQRHKYYCGIDLHTRVMYVCITDEKGDILVHKNMKTDPAAFTTIIEPYKKDLAVAVECVFVWYWIADLCNQLGLTFVLGHALYMKAGLDNVLEQEYRPDSLYVFGSRLFLCS